jgi:DNA-binding CsgD family transcriptional regulator
MALIVPHVRRALRIGNATGLEHPGNEVFADVLDGLNTAIFIVDEQGRIVHANVTGHDMLYANDILRSVGGRLTASDAQVNHTFKDLFAAAAKGDASFGAKATAQAMTAHDGERYVAHVLPLTSGERRWTGIAFASVAAVFVRKVALESSIDSIAQTYKLTPTELRVLNSIVEVGGVPETAEALRMAGTTVKTHLYRIFEKTNASRQADLVKLVAGYSNPLLNQPSLVDSS